MLKRKKKNRRWLVLYPKILIGPSFIGLTRSSLATSLGLK